MQNLSLEIVKTIGQAFDVCHKNTKHNDDVTQHNDGQHQQVKQSNDEMIQLINTKVDEILFKLNQIELQLNAKSSQPNSHIIQSPFDSVLSSPSSHSLIH